MSPVAATRLLKVLGVSRDEPALRMERLAELRDFPSGSAARQFIMRHRAYFAFRKVGRRVVITVRDFDRGCAKLEAARQKRSA